MPLTAYVDSLAVGDPLPDAPLFLAPGWYVNVPLEQTYMASWDVTPSRFAISSHRRKPRCDSRECRGRPRDRHRGRPPNPRPPGAREACRSRRFREGNASYRSGSPHPHSGFRDDASPNIEPAAVSGTLRLPRLDLRRKTKAEASLFHWERVSTIAFCSSRIQARPRTTTRSVLRGHQIKPFCP